MERIMKIDYYQVVLPSEELRTFADLLELLSQTPNDATRNKDYQGVPIRLQEIRKINAHWLGDMVKIRMDGIPPKTKLTGRQEDIDLDDDEGLGEETAFLFDTRTGVLVFQRNKFAVSATAFAHYLVLMCGVEDVGLRPALRSDAMARLQTFTQHRKLEIAIAGLNNLRLFRGAGRGVEELVTLSNEFQAPSISLTVSMGHNKGTLAKVKDCVESLIETFQQAGGAGPTPITKILVSGKEGEDQPTEIIDLLEDRMVDLEKVDLGRDHEVSRNARQGALNAAFLKRKAELENLFASPGS
jgi:hypothetical protein